VNIGKKEIDFAKARKHANQISQKQSRERKSRLLASLLEKESLAGDDLGMLHGLLTPKQKLVLSLVGLSHLSWSVHHAPKKLMTMINDLVKKLRG
jgi:hypothetical protein